MYLNKEEEKIFDGEKGLAAEKAIKLLVALGDICKANKLIESSGSHILSWEAVPGEKIAKTVKIVSNYNEKFSIEPLLSSRGIVNVVNQKEIRNGYELQLEITPPQKDEQARAFTDILGVKLPGIGNLRIDCNGFYKGAKSSRASKEEEECRTCGPKIVRFAN